MRSTDEPSRTAPALTAAVFQVLLSLAYGDKHGYAILKDVEDASNGEVRLSTGTLYAMIKRLLADGLIAECKDRPAAENDDERRRYYGLTPLGRSAAAAEAERMEGLIAMARERKLLRKLRTV